MWPSTERIFLSAYLSQLAITILCNLLSLQAHLDLSTTLLKFILLSINIEQRYFGFEFGYLGVFRNFCSISKSAKLSLQLPSSSSLEMGKYDATLSYDLVANIWLRGQIVGSQIDLSLRTSKYFRDLRFSLIRNTFRN